MNQGPTTTTTTFPAADAPADAPGAPDDEPRMFLTAAEVRRELGVGASRVYALAAAGWLPVFHLGRRIYFPRRGLERLAAGAQAQTRAAGAEGRRR
jgi:hypothetical protein